MVIKSSLNILNFLSLELRSFLCFGIQQLNPFLVSLFRLLPAVVVSQTELALLGSLKSVARVLYRVPRCVGFSHNQSRVRKQATDLQCQVIRGADKAGHH